MSNPEELFPLSIGREAIPHVHRLIHREDSEQILIYTDGACLDNGRTNPKAGWAFVFDPESDMGIV